MRLIDAEKVEEEINECVWDAYGSNEDEMGNAYCIARGIIENAPSVEAIPVIYLEKKREMHRAILGSHELFSEAWWKEKELIDTIDSIIEGWRTDCADGSIDNQASGETLRDESIPERFIRSWLPENTFDPELGSHLAEAMIKDWRTYEQRKP